MGEILLVTKDQMEQLKNDPNWLPAPGLSPALKGDSPMDAVRRAQTGARKFRKRLVVVEARGPIADAELVTTAHGRVRAEAGDYILTDPTTGDTWPIKPDIFAATYEAVDE